jgi:bifunctional UDP-N-acetylglucosamine pyrophosphorylase/glucosamine-1-phosphate N-acetyltransferase
MINDFFSEIAVPEFLKKEFEKEDWYLVIAHLIDILQGNVPSVQIGSPVGNLIYHGKVRIGQKCKIGDNVVIDGPVYIGDDVEISTGAYIRAGSIISDGCSIGHAAEIKNAVMMEGSKIANHVFLGDSILGLSARMGGHSETANRLFEQSEISFNYKDKKLFTGLTKLGAIIGEGSRLGGGVFTHPGTMIGKNTFIATCVDIGGYIPANQFVKIKHDYEFKINRFAGKLVSDK